MKSLFRPIAALLLLILFTNSCGQFTSASAGDGLSGNVSVSGAFALYPLMTRWVEEFQRVYPGVRFDISSGGAGKGMEDILAKQVDIGMVSREITSTEESQGAYPIAVARDAVFALINAENPAREDLMAHGLSQERLVKIFITGQITTWGQAVNNPNITDKINIYTRSDICGAGATWSLYLGDTQANLLGDGKFGDPGMVQAVKSDPLGIGYNNLIYAYGLGDVAPKGTVILPIDLNANGQADSNEILDTRQKAADAVASGRYPAPPSRALFLVTNGKPSGIVQAFLTWALTDGQAFVERSGYVQLTATQLNAAVERIR